MAPLAFVIESHSGTQWNQDTRYSYSWQGTIDTLKNNKKGNKYGELRRSLIELLGTFEPTTGLQNQDYTRNFQKTS